MAYVQLAKALYDYEAQAEDELTLKEDDVLYILEADDPEWYKAKVKSGAGGPDDEGPVGLVPANYVEEAEPMRLSRALYAYAAQNEDELDIAEDELLRVYETDGLWLLVKKQGNDALGEGGVGRLGYVPANYVDEVAAVDTGDAPDEVDEQELSHSTSAAPAAAIPFAPSARAVSSSTPAVDKSDGIKMWAVSLLDAKKKKKKGTLGIGNGALFFASESDKTPVQKIPVLSILAHAIENKGKQIHIDLDASAGIEGDAINFVTEKKQADEIAAKLDESKGKAEVMAQKAQEEPQQEEEEEYVQAAGPPARPAPPAPPAAPAAPPAPPAPAFQPPPTRSAAILPPPVRKTATSPAPPTPAAEAPPAANGHAASSDGEPAIALYDFEAQGDDELTVAENESLTLVERENDDWWKVRNASGQEGVVPASYIEVAEAGSGASAGAAGASAAAASSNDAEAEAEAEAERQRQEEEAAEREREQLLAAEQRRKEARDRLAREAEERRRREALKAQPAPAPPKSAPSTAADNARAARDVKIPEGRSAPARPKEAGSKSKPAPGRTRVWHDRSGQFRVEAEFLGFNQGKLRLHKINGVVIEVAIEKMSRPDIQYLEEVTGKQLMPSSRRSGAGPSSSTAVGAPLSPAGPADPRQSERERERRKEKEREARRRAEAGRGPRRNVDWFEFFLAAGVDVHDCTRYASAFERENVDDTVLEHMDPSVLRSLGLREGDNIRVMKHIEKKYGARRAAQGQTSSRGGGSADIDKQMKADEELARKLQEQERAARRDGGTSPTGLFSGPDGSLKNNTRRGRPTPKTTTDSGVDPASIAKAGESLSRVSSPPTRASTTSPKVERSAAKSGFDDDAWTPKPSTAKPSTPKPAPPPAAPTPPPAPPAPAAAASPAPAPAAAPAAPATPAEPPKPAADPNSALFDKLAAMKAPSAGIDRPGASPSPSNSFMGGAYNGARGPMAPVPQNQGLLQPLVPTQGTGQYVPTRGGMGMQATGMGGMGLQPTGMGMQQTGWGGGMGAQQTGYYGGAQGGMQSQPTGWMGPQQTAMPPQSTNISGFGGGGMASPLPPAQQQQQPQPTGQSTTSNGSSNASGDKYGAGSIFASMKSGTFAQGDASKAQQPQQAQRYDALRPQPTGWSPAGVQQPQPTGWGMGPQMTGMGMGGMGMSGMQPQYTAQPQQQQQQTGYGFGPQQTGYGQQQQGYGGYGGYQGGY